MIAIDSLRKIVSEFDASAEAAHELWSWLPSKVFAEKAHGDYAADRAGHHPSTVMNEAMMVFSYFAGFVKLEEAESREAFSCACGECPIPKESELRKVLEDLRGKVSSPHRKSKKV